MAATIPPAEPPASFPPPPVPVAPLPWEQPGYPALEALYETTVLLLTRPSEAFARMQVAGDLGRPLIFAVVLGWIGVIASMAYNLVFPGGMFHFLPGFPRGEGFSFSILATAVTMIAAPVLVLLAVFIWSAIVHLLLLLVGGATSGFPATVRVVCYATSTQVLQIIPVVGGPLGTIWAIVLEIIGLAIAHRTSQGKAAFAVLLPVALCCACFTALMVAVVLGIISLAALANLK